MALVLLRLSYEFLGLNKYAEGVMIDTLTSVDRTTLLQAAISYRPEFLFYIQYTYDCIQIRLYPVLKVLMNI